MNYTFTCADGHVYTMSNQTPPSVIEECKNEAAWRGCNVSARQTEPINHDPVTFTADPFGTVTTKRDSDRN